MASRVDTSTLDPPPMMVRPPGTTLSDVTVTHLSSDSEKNVNEKVRRGYSLSSLISVKDRSLRDDIKRRISYFQIDTEGKIRLP